MKTLIVLLTLLFLLPGSGRSEVRYSRDQALKLAFPRADRIEPRNLFLNDSERAAVGRAAGTHLDSGLYTFYVGYRGGEVTGYAAIEAATVRTQPATVMVVLNPDRSVRLVEILAFFEPPEYRPQQRWLAQFGGRRLGPQLRVGSDIQGITGATLSAQALTRQVRKTLAMAAYLERKD